MLKYLFLIFFFSSNVFAQTQQDQFNKQLEDIMKARAEMLKSLMDDSMSGDFEKRMEEIMKNFGNQGDFGFGAMEAPVVGEYDWIETDTHKILKVKVKQIKDKPLDIKIQNNEIKIKGEVESTQVQGQRKIIQRSQFEKTFEMPDDIDKTGPEFENTKDGFMNIKFKKLTASRVPKKGVQTPVKKDKPIPERLPVGVDKDDLSI